MSNVYTTLIGVPKTARNKRIYGEGGSFSNSVVNNVDNASIVTPKDVIEFTDVVTPTITDYNTLYAPTHGQYPSVRCHIDVDATTGFELQLMPQFTYIDGLIDTIWFDAGWSYSGKIILQ